jgi:NAD+ kinase
MRHFTLITNVYKDQELELTRRMTDYIRAHGGTAEYLLSNVRQQGQEFQAEDIPKDTELIFVLGGDGTLIRAATAVEALGIPLIGVNLGTLGYLCELDEATVFPAIDQILNDNYMMEERMMLCGHRDGETETRPAFNDIVIHRSGDLTILSLIVYVNGEVLYTYHADGIIVATPNGSTGYNMSAGGPIVDPKAQIILLTPINAHNLNSKSIVLGPEDEVMIEIAPRSYEDKEKASVSFDGDSVVTLKPGERFVISKAPNITKICKLNNLSFLELLRRKMENYT